MYDSLNDDDDDVREIASAAVRSILGQALVPLEAANHLLQWLTRNFHDSRAFRHVLLDRIVGEANVSTNYSSWTSARDQLSEAMKFDDSLFVVEEQNLFIDEVREADRWTAAFKALQWEASDSGLHALDGWMASGLECLRDLANREDGPLGWASKPQVFAICSRVVRGVAALMMIDYSLDHREALASSSEVLRSYPSHISGLLLRPLVSTSDLNQD